jgi:predicted amidohydrolase
MRPITVAALQLDLKMTNNFEAIRAEVMTVKRVYPQVDMVLLAELCWFGPDVTKAVELPGREEDFMRKLAKDAGIWLVAGSLYEKVGDKIYNTCPVIDPRGEVVQRYHKIYPFLPYETGVACGDRCQIFEVPGIGKFGVSICYDMWMPETMRQMTAMGAEVILHPSMTNTVDREAEVAISRANAAMHQVYFLDLNLIGLGVGRSGIYGPGGEILCQASLGREILIVELDLDHVARVRERGWHGLGQVLKSYRDADVHFPIYDKGANAAFDGLGPMHFHQAKKY